MKIKRAFVPVLCLALCVAFNIACNQENMSKVTLYFGQNIQSHIIEKNSIFDRIFNAIYTKAHAKPQWKETSNSIILTISSDNMDTITVSIPPSVSSYTVEVPIGNSRLFTMFSYNGSEKNWGGHTLANINEQEHTIALTMNPIVTGFYANSGSTEVGLGWDEVSGVTGYKIYRADSEFGPYQYIGSSVGSWNRTYNDFSGVYGVYYYYSVTVYTTTYEGDRCDSKRQRMY